MTTASTQYAIRNNFPARELEPDGGMQDAGCRKDDIVRRLVPARVIANICPSLIDNPNLDRIEPSAGASGRAFLGKARTRRTIPT